MASVGTRMSALPGRFADFDMTVWAEFDKDAEFTRSSWTKGFKDSVWAYYTSNGTCTSGHANCKIDKHSNHITEGYCGTKYKGFPGNWEIGHKSGLEFRAIKATLSECLDPYKDDKLIVKQPYLDYAKDIIRRIHLEHSYFEPESVEGNRDHSGEGNKKTIGTNLRDYCQAAYDVLKLGLGYRTCFPKFFQ